MNLRLWKVLGLMAMLLMGAFASAQHSEYGSFLTRHVSTVPQLVEQVRTDAKARERFRRHFRMQTPQLLEMLSHLHVGKLKETGAYIVYNVHEDGVIRAKVFQMTKGTTCFMDEHDTPILKMSCGNPMIAPTEQTALSVKPSGAVSAREILIPSPAPTPPLVPEMVPPTPVVAPAEVAAPAPPTVVNSAVVEAGHTGFIFIPLLFFFREHGSCCCNCCNQPVPEPTSLLVMGFGASCLLFRRRRKNALKA